MERLMATIKHDKQEFTIFTVSPQNMEGIFLQTLFIGIYKLTHEIFCDRFMLKNITISKSNYLIKSKKVVKIFN